MEVSLFDYVLPKKLISQKLILPRDRCKLLVYSREKKEIKHNLFCDIQNYLGKDDVLVLNNTKVFPARMTGFKETGGKIEIFLVRPIDNDFGVKVNNTWNILINKKVKEGEKISFNIKKKVVLVGIVSLISKEVTIKFEAKGKELWENIYLLGNMPLPPYIKSQKDQKHYQTVYAKNIGSCAAPTAGFHFTDRLIKKLKEKGVKIEYVTLSVGLGTFKPIKVDTVEDHKMDTEFLFVDKQTINRLNKYKKEGKKIVAVGTTVVRTLESIYVGNEFKSDILQTNIFIYPGYKFRAVDKFITNFHLPRSTPLMMVVAFIMDKQKDFELSRSELLRIYMEAIKKKYMFYSFGEAMFLE